MGKIIEHFEIEKLLITREKRLFQINVQLFFKEWREMVRKNLEMKKRWTWWIEIEVTGEGGRIMKRRDW